MDGIAGLDRRDDVFEEILFKCSKGWSASKDIALGSIVFLSTTIGHHHDHGLGLTIGNQVVKEVINGGKAVPFGLITTDTMQEVEDWVTLVWIITWRCVNMHLPIVAHTFGAVGDHL